MSRWLRGFGVVAMAVGLAACVGVSAPATSTSVPAASSTIRQPSTAPSGAASLSPSRSASTSTSPSASLFESARHGYRVEVPPGWIVHEYGGSWKSLSEFTPGGEIPGEDAIAPAGFGSFLVMNSMAIPTDMTAGEWRSTFEALVAAGLPPDCPGSPRSATFAGEPATILEQTCAGKHIVGRTLVHAGRGYYFTTLSPHPDPAMEAIVARLAASIDFTN